MIGVTCVVVDTTVDVVVVDLVVVPVDSGVVVAVVVVVLAAAIVSTASLGVARSSWYLYSCWSTAHSRSCHADHRFCWWNIPARVLNRTEIPEMRCRPVGYLQRSEQPAAPHRG